MTPYGRFSKPVAALNANVVRLASALAARSRL
jgi:hypothetical protein